MKTEDIKNYTTQYIALMENYKNGDSLPEYVKMLEVSMHSSDEVAEAFKNDPKGLKRMHKSKLSDKSVLRIFSHPDSDDLMTVVEYPDGKLSWSSTDDIDVIKAMHHARLPEEYVFSIIHEPGYDMQIAIVPKYIADADYRNVPTNYDTSIGELEPMWNTAWFSSFFDNFLSTHSEAIFTSKDENKTVEEMKILLEKEGLIYDIDLEKEQLEACDLQPQYGASYKPVNLKI